MAAVRRRWLAAWGVMVGLALGAAPAAAQVQEVFVPSNTSWTVTDEGGGALGNAQFVCLRADQPQNCPAGATVWQYPGLGSDAWYQDLSAIPNGRYIWAPGIDAQSIIFNTFYVFRRSFTLNGPPLSGNFFVTADDYAEVRVNGTLVGTVGRITGFGGARPLRSFNILPFLVQGTNTIEVKAKNGDNPEFPCANCATYGFNPAGVVFGGRITAGVPTSGPTAPGTPNNVRMEANGSIIDATWGPPVTGGTVTGYTLVGRLVDNGPILAAVPLGDTLDSLIQAPNGTFRVSLRASGPGGTGPESSATTVALPQAVALPGPPTGVRSSATGSALTIRWDPPSSGGPVLYYRLFAALTPNGVPALVVPGLTRRETSFTVQNAPPGTYYVSVAAENGAGVGPRSSEGVVAVGALSAPVLAAPTVAGSTVGLSWTIAGSSPTSYDLLVATSAGGPPTTVLALPAGTSATLGVPPGVRGTFFLRLAARNGAVVGPPSNEVVLVLP